MAFDKVIRWKDEIDRQSMLLAFQSFSLQIDACGELTLTGCVKLAVCGEKHVGVICRGRTVDLYGEELAVKASEGGRVIVGGRILSVQFGSTEEAADAKRGF